MSATIRDTDHGFAALLERAAKARGAVTVGVHADAPAAAYAAKSEYAGRLGIRDFVDGQGSAIARALTEAASAAVIEGTASLPDALQRAGDSMAAAIRSHVPHRSGRLAASVTAEVAK